MEAGAEDSPSLYLEVGVVDILSWRRPQVMSILYYPFGRDLVGVLLSPDQDLTRIL